MSPDRRSTTRQQPEVHWAPINIAARQVRVWVKNWMFAWTAYMGDTKIQEQTGEREIHHTYAQPGCYWLFVTRQGEMTAIGEAQLVIRPGRYPEPTFSRHPDLPNVARVHWPELDETRVVSDYLINWEPASHDPVYQTVTGYPGTYTEHVYDEAKDFSVTITDLQTRRIRRFDPRLPIPTVDPDFTLEIDSGDPSGRTVKLTVTANSSGKALFVAWGDGTLAVPVANNSATHTYRSTVDTTFLVQLWHSNASDSTTKPIAIPGGSS